MEISGIVMKLVGPVHPVGDSRIDEARLKNIKELTDLVDTLLGTISSVTADAGRPEASRNAIGKHARDFLLDVHEGYFGE